MDVRLGLWRRLSAEELTLLNCGVGADSWESLGLQGDPSSPFWRRSALGFLWKEWCWSWNSSVLATSCEELTHWKRPWCWEGLGAGGEGDDRQWDGWMASPTRWTWIWVNSGSWWWAERPGVLQFMGSQSPTRLSDWSDLIWSNEEMTMTLYELRLKSMFIKSKHENSSGKSHPRDTPQNAGSVVFMNVKSIKSKESLWSSQEIWQTKVTRYLGLDLWKEKKVVLD